MGSLHASVCSMPSSTLIKAQAPTFKAAVDGEGSAGPLAEVSQSMILSSSGVEGGCLLPPALPLLPGRCRCRTCSSTPCSGACCMMEAGGEGRG